MEFCGGGEIRWLEGFVIQSSPVICDNTNSKHSDFAQYVDYAKKMSYTVKEIVLPHPNIDEATKRNIHAVPASVIQKMIEQWEE